MCYFQSPAFHRDTSAKWERPRLVSLIIRRPAGRLLENLESQVSQLPMSCPNHYYQWLGQDIGRGLCRAADPPVTCSPVGPNPIIPQFQASADWEHWENDV